jgi:hypothetical protein
METPPCAARPCRDTLRPMKPDLYTKALRYRGCAQRDRIQSILRSECSSSSRPARQCGRARRWPKKECLSPGVHNGQVSGQTRRGLKSRLSASQKSVPKLRPDGGRRSPGVAVGAVAKSCPKTTPLLLTPRSLPVLRANPLERVFPGSRKCLAQVLWERCTCPYPRFFE